MSSRTLSVVVVLMVMIMSIISSPPNATAQLQDNYEYEDSTPKRLLSLSCPFQWPFIRSLSPLITPLVRQFSLHATQAGPQKTPQICVLLLQVASLSDFKSVSVIILMTSWCIRHLFDDILMHPTLFWSHFQFWAHFFHRFFWKCAP